METRATARRGLHEDSVSPTAEKKSPNAHRMDQEGSSPKRVTGSPRLSEAVLQDMSSSEEDGNDEVDRCSSQTTNLYPNLSKVSPKSDGDSSFGLSPGSNSEHDSPEDLRSMRSRKGKPCTQSHRPHRDHFKKNFPMTPEKGSPGKKLYPDVVEGIPRSNYRGPTPIIVIGFAFTLIFCIAVTYHYYKKAAEDLQAKQEIHVKTLEEVREDFVREVRDLIQDFKQSRHFWVELNAQFESILQEFPQQPGVILVVVPEDSQGTAICLIHKIAKAISLAFDDKNFVMYDMKSIGHRNHNQIKIDLDSSLQGLRDAHAAVIHNIEIIPGKAAMIFHAFCDNENAPFKQAILFPMMEVSGRYEEVFGSRLDYTVDDHLAKLWGEELEIKDVSSVISRVANSPVVVKPIDSARLQKLCPI